MFLPSVARAGPRLASEEPYQAMWQGVNSSYANFRYWSETILAAGNVFLPVSHPCIYSSDGWPNVFIMEISFT